MAIRKSKINIDTEERSDFDNMMNDVENEVEVQQAEDGLVAENGGYPPTQNGDIRSLFWLFSLMALQN